MLRVARISSGFLYIPLTAGISHHRRVSTIIVTVFREKDFYEVRHGVAT